MAWAFDMSVHKKQKRIIRHRVWPGFLLAMLILSGCQDRSEDQQAKDNASGVVGARLSEERLLSTPDAEAIGANNRAVGLMGRFEYGAALGIFSALVKKYPHWRDVKLNLAIATLNRQRPGDEQAALAFADEVLATDPEQPRAHYIAGLLRLYLASPEQAIGHFARVVKQDPDDAYAAYYLGQCLAQQSKPEKALDAYRRALDIDPYLRSAAYGAFQALQRLRRKEEARGFIEQYQRLATNPRARLAEFKYTRMGSKAEALALNTPTTGKQPLPPPPHGPIFADKAPFPVQASAAKAEKPAIKKDAGDPDSGETSPLRRFTDNNDVRPVSMTVMDLESDGQRDLFVAGAGKGSQHNLLLSGTPDGRFVRREDHPLTGVAHVNAVLWGDFDNDGHLDAYLCRQGANQLWRNDGKNWLDVTATTDTWNGTFNTVDGAFFDADHDGDLDIFLVNEDGPNGLLYNNRDGTFRTDNMGERTQNRASLAVIPADLDRDRDTDIIVLNRKLPHEVYINDRLWAYHGSPNLSAFESRPALSATVGDLDSDGLPEIYTLTPEGELIRWSRDGRGDFAPTVLSDGLLTAKMEETWARMTMLDADGDGVLELLIATPNGWSVMSAAEPTAAGWWGNPGLIPRFMAAVPDDKLLGVTPLLLDPGKGFGVAGLLAGDDPDSVRTADLVHWAPGPGRHPFLSLAFSGMEDVAKSMRSNASGIGTRMSLRTGTRWTIVENFQDHIGPGQGLQPVPVGLGGAPRIDFVAIDWSDGVLQSELDLAAGQLHRITETQRQLSSCPVLFAWDGEKYAFITDFLGVGGMGYAIGPGEYSVPRPWENLLLPPSVQPRQNHYSIKLTEPMEEVAYMDAVRLVAYDLPPGWRMVLDERMGIGEPEPTGAAIFYRDEILPEKAVNDRAQTVTSSVILADGRAAPVGALDRRFIGRLAGEHILTLTFPHDLTSKGTVATDSGSKKSKYKLTHGKPAEVAEVEQSDPPAPSRQPVLIIDGWVEYPYSQTMFAAWQANAAWEAPTVEALGSDGKWHTVLTRFGYPAGMVRRMSVPLPNLPAGTSRLRIRTNQEIYWDRIAVAFPAPLPELRKHTLPLENARLAVVGFPKRTDGPQRRPQYDYGHRRPFADMRAMTGFYTESGPVHELLADADDALAIFGAGEEIHVDFLAPEAPLPTDWRRYLVLETHGWTKDRDLYTKDGETVGPLPGRGKAGKRREELHAKYNTRLIFR